MNLDDLARQFLVLEKTDSSPFQRRARLLQSIWRAEKGYEAGLHGKGEKARLLGSRLPMPWAQQTLANFLTPTIQNVVRSEVLDPKRSRGKLYGKPRIFNDLLSSQPMAFNLFGELQQDLTLCSALVSDLTSGRFPQVESVDFEHSPGRSDPRFTGDRSAFDVFLRCRTGDGAPAFLGIEVKYHENLKGKSGKHRPRYDEIADDAGCFSSQNRDRLKQSPLQQIWRDHLLACALLQAGDFIDGQFVFLYPAANPACSSAIAEYRSCLTDSSTLADWTLETVVASLERLSHAPWIRLFRERYLAFERIESAA